MAGSLASPVRTNVYVRLGKPPFSAHHSSGSAGGSPSSCPDSPLYHETFPLKDAAKAHEAMERLDFFGKLVLTVP